MKMNRFFLLVAAGLLLLMSSCATVYHNQLVSIPLISEQGELQLQAGGSLNDFATANLSVAYGVSDKLAFQGFGRINSGDDLSLYHLQLALGRYAQNENGHIKEFYGGVAFGMHDFSLTFGRYYADLTKNSPMKLDRTDYYTEDYEAVNGNYQMLYVQGNIGKKFKNVEWALGCKLGGIYATIQDYQENYVGTFLVEDPSTNTSYTRDVFETVSYSYHPLNLLLEPQFEVRFGWEHFKFSYRIGFSIFGNSSPELHRIYYTGFNSGLGIHYRF